MARLQPTWQEGFRGLLEYHQVLDPVVDTLSWKRPPMSAFIFFSGIYLYLLNVKLNLGIMMIIGIIAIMQILVYRFLRFLKKHKFKIIPKDLREKFVVTPKPETLSVTVKVVGDVLRLVEEKIKQVAVSESNLEILQAFMLLIFIAAVGRVTSLPNILLGVWIFAFAFFPIYNLKAELFDRYFWKEKAPAEKEE